MREASLREHLDNIIKLMDTSADETMAWHVEDLKEWQKRWLNLYCKDCESCILPCNKEKKDGKTYTAE